MIDRPSIAMPNSAQMLGDLHVLAQQLGPGDPASGLMPGTLILRNGPVNSMGRLREFLYGYQKQVLVPLELPAIYQAFQFACHNQLRELIALDQDLAQDPKVKTFAAASCRVGQRQLNRLLPLRDQRFVQRYLRAVQSGQAHGWHILVYGIILSLYSLPLRPGLLNYTQQTVRGFIYAASRPLRLAETECQQLLAEICLSARPELEKILSQGSKPQLC